VTLHAPSYAGGFASPERGLIDRSQWDGVTGAWCPSLGATGLTLRDHSGRGNHGTLANVLLSSAWASPAGLALDGTNDEINLGRLLNTAAGTVSLWIRTTDTNVATRVFTDTGGYCYVDLQSAGSVRASLYDTGYKRVTVSTTDVTDGLWHLIVMRWDSTSMTIQVDSDALGSVAAGAINSGVSGYDFVVGGTGAAGSHTAMDVDDIRIWHRAISAGEITRSYRLGPGGMYRRQLTHNVKTPAAGRINSLVGVGGGMIGQGGGMIGRGY
jgi:hypothetical protein